MRISDMAMQAGMNFAKMISISDFSKGKTSTIFKDVNENGIEYIVLKNNLPTGVVIPYSIYQELKNKILEIQNNFSQSANAKSIAFNNFMSLSGILSSDISLDEAREERLSKI